MGAPLNLDGVRHEKPRRLIDTTFRALADGLEAAYYGHWRHGVSHPWRGFDLQVPSTGSGPAASKALFDRLHGAIWHAYDLAFAEANAGLPDKDRVPVEMFNVATRDDRGRATTKLARARARLDAEPEILAMLEAWASSEGLALGSKPSAVSSQLSAEGAKLRAES